MDGGPLGVELLEVEEADEAVARACLGASIARVLHHAAVIGTGLRGKGEEGGGQEEEHRGGCQDVGLPEVLPQQAACNPVPGTV